MISLQHGLLIFVFVTFITWLCVYLDGRFSDKTKKKGDYIKAIILTNMISFTVVYLLLWLAPSGSITDVAKVVSNKITGTVAKVAEIGEDMLAGPAPF